MIKVAEQLISTLKELGVKYIFGVPSGNWVDYLEVIRKTPGIEFILVSNEASGGFMADVHWRLTGNMAACFGTFGPGACNLSTGVCGGRLDRSPMIALGDEPDDEMVNRITQMNINQQELFKPITKIQSRLKPGRIRETLHEAYKIALSEVPGPVYIGIPSGIAGLQSDEKLSGLPDIPEIGDPAEAELKKMADLFKASEKPIIAAGITAVRLRAGKYITELADRYGIPVILTPMAKGLIHENHSWYGGVLSHAMSDIVAETYQQADLVMGIGYDPVEFNYEEWMPGAQLIHMDTTNSEMTFFKERKVQNVIGNINTGIKRLINSDVTKKMWDPEEIVKRKKEIFTILGGQGETFDTLSVLKELRKKLPDNGIMTCDVGAHLHLTGQAWKAFSPENQQMTNGCSSMGFGIPAAISAKLSKPERDVVCITGDGGFLMMAGEMATVKRLGLKVIFIILNDGELSLISIKQDKKNYSTYGTGLFKKTERIGDSFFGVPVITASSIKTYRNALENAFATDGPSIIEVIVKKEDYENFILKGNKLN
ncbi:MAG: thiamine pyrophosphate-binding protein [Acidobacteriota bacterium]